MLSLYFLLINVITTFCFFVFESQLSAPGAAQQEFYQRPTSTSPALKSLLSCLSLPRSMQCCWTAALVSIPSDVTQQHIMRLLSRADLVALGMTCSAMQKIFSRWMLCLDEKERSKARFQSELLDELFRVGCFSQLVWFQKSLKYLCRDKLNEKKKILLASKGDELPRLVMQ